jgi:WD40 repeat protein
MLPFVLATDDRYSLAAHLRLAVRGPALPGHTKGVLWGAWAQLGDAAVLATGGGDGMVRLWDPATGFPLQTALAGHAGAVLWGAWGQLGGAALLATGGADGTVRLWNPASGTLLGPALGGHDGGVMWGAWGEVDNATVLATGDGGGHVRLWNPVNGRRIGRAVTSHDSAVLWGAISQVGDAPTLATGGADGRVLLWNLAVGTLRARGIFAHIGRALWGAWEQVDNAPVLATGGDMGRVLLWGRASGLVSGRILTSHARAVLWGAWGSVGDAAVLATGGEDGTVRLWDPGTGTLLEPALVGHAGAVLWGTWGKVDDAAVLATGGEDGTVRLWNPVTGSALGPALTGHAGAVLWGGWGHVEDAGVLATGSADGTVRLWGLVREVAVPRVPRYSSDAARAADLLGRQSDAAALADVITARSARPPLAIGVFGQWGEGKSLFLEMLEVQVGDRARAAGPSDPIAHGSVRQVRFNAWHYAEADLWASLVAELFAQLSAPLVGSDPMREQRQRSRLASELVVARGMREQLVAAEGRLADLHTARKGNLGGWEALPAPARQRLQELFGDHAEAAYRRNAISASSIGNTGRAVIGLLRETPRRYLAGAAMAALIAAALAVWGPGLVRWVAALPAAAVLLGAVEGWRRTGPLRERLGAVREAAQRVRDEQTRRLQTAEMVAAAEVKELRSRLQNLTSAGQLAGLVEERVGAGAYRERLGLMTQIRQDFERMAELLLGAGQPEFTVTDAAGDRLPSIDRIVVYIDDLDRCPPQRVVEVLEAVHLLLAVRLFVVVVAVDPRWLLRSLTSHYQQLFATTTGTPHAAAGTSAGLTVDLGEDELWASTPAQYLEKIFQIVLTLAPMERAGYQRMIDDLVGMRANPPTVPTGTPDPDETPARSAEAATSSSSPLSPTRHALPRFTLGALPVIERLDPLAVTADEHQLIGMLGPPLITAPRAVKRLANSYGLLVALSASNGLGGARRPDLDPIPDLDPQHDAYPYRGGMVLLAAVIGFPMLGPSFFPDLHHAAAANPRRAWGAHLNDLRPIRDDRGWGNRTEAVMTDARAQHWHAFLDALDDIGTRATSAGLPLPQRLDIWAQWVVPVGRLSFPTGSAVSRLAKSATYVTESVADEE